MDILNSIVELTKGNTSFLGVRIAETPTTEEEYDNLDWIVDVDDIGSAVYGTRPVNAPTWAEVSAKLVELESAEPLRLLRKERDRLIAETDWWVLPDRTPTDEQLAYRQALRDITETYTSLDDVVWPTKPE
jgi:hypothetical protein